MQNVTKRHTEQVCKALSQLHTLDWIKNIGHDVFLMLQKSLDSFTKKDFSTSRKICNEIYDLCWEKIHTGHWSQVHIKWREGFAFCAWLRVLNQLNIERTNLKKEDAIQIIKLLDLGIMMGGELYKRELHELVESVHDYCVETYGLPKLEQKTKNEKIEKPAKKRKIDREWMKETIPRVSRLSLQEFEEKYLKKQVPVIITDALEDWPAMRPKEEERSWENIDYIRRIAGYRTVPVEIGEDYVSADWTQRLMTINEYIDGYLYETEDERKGYLAQHQLFEQIRPLKKDVLEPIYCASGNGILHQVNAWFGPCHTKSPLHTDRYNNVLCQIVGEKYIRLYHPDETENLYPHEQDSMLFNTSRIRDVFNVDLEKFPKFKLGKFDECILKKGEMLFIPVKYWHYVESLSISFSVSFWWE